jgi:hypothetical protein
MRTCARPTRSWCWPRWSAQDLAARPPSRRSQRQAAFLAAVAAEELRQSLQAPVRHRQRHAGAGTPNHEPLLPRVQRP